MILNYLDHNYYKKFIFIQYGTIWCLIRYQCFNLMNKYCLTDSVAAMNNLYPNGSYYFVLILDFIY